MPSTQSKQAIYNEEYFSRNAEKSLLLWEFLQNSQNVETTNVETLKEILHGTLKINGHITKDKILSLGKYIEKIGNANKMRFVANFEFCFAVAIRYAMLL